MNKQVQKFEEKEKRTDLPDIEAGDKVKIWQKIGEKEGGKERVTPFTGIVIARKHGNETGATITVRGRVKGIAVEKIFPVHSPTIRKIEIIEKHSVRRSKLYYLRERKGKKARLKRKE